MLSSSYELLLDAGPPPSTNRRGSQEALPNTQSEPGDRPRVRSRSITGATRPAAAAGGATDKKTANTQHRLVQPATGRQKDKFVPLPVGLASSGDLDLDETSGSGGEAEQLSELSRIAAYCLAESFDRKQLEARLEELYKGRPVDHYSDVVHLTLSATGSRVSQDAFFFNFGVVITFGLTKEQEAEIMQQVVARVAIKSYSVEERETDEFQFQHSATEPPHIKNDTFTINKRQAKSPTVRLAIAYALAQSSKLSVYEEQVWDLVEDTRNLPEILAQSGKVAVSPKTVTKLIGRVFLQNANVNLQSSVLDTPAFFWNAPDHLQALYERACEYLELEARVEVLNARFLVLQELLDMLRNQQNNYHGSRLEIIIIWLLVVDCILMLFQLLSLFGIIGQSSST